jgi:C_GCAxxG_C_C family probable redox protein
LFVVVSKSGTGLLRMENGWEGVMSEKVEAAVACFREGFNCAQAILSTWGGEYGLERETALRAASAFGAGMGCLGEVCGSVTGALIVLGLKYGRTEAKDKETKERNHAMVGDFAGRFRSRNGSLLCRELLGCDLTTAEGMDEAKQKGLFTERCPRFVRDAAEILEDVL